MLSLNDHLMIAGAFVGDFVYDLVAGSSAAYKERRLSFWIPPRRKSTLSVYVCRLLKTGSFEKVVKNGVPYLRITNSGKEGFFRDFPLLKFRNKPWDGYWSVVSYDIPEKKKEVRESLREKLVSLGFGGWQKSVYISPHDLCEDLKEFIESEKLDSCASVVRVNGLTDDDKELAFRVFNLKKLSERYFDLLFKLKELVKSKDVPKEIYEQYFDLLLDDPLLPKELLPRDWPERELRLALFKR